MRDTNKEWRVVVVGASIFLGKWFQNLYFVFLCICFSAINNFGSSYNSDIFLKILAEVPDQWDWREKPGTIEPVHNQGQRPNAVTLDVSDAVEARYFIQTNIAANLSSTQLTDCCGGNYGTNYTGVYDCIVRIGGLCSDADYPVTPSGQCNKCNATITVCWRVPQKTTI